MPRFPVSPEKEQALAARLAALGISEADLDEQFIHASGPGGQRLNKVAVRVRLTHRPSGLEVTCARTRFQALNRYHARQLLADKLDTRRLGQAAAAARDRARIRRQKQRRSRRTRLKMLADKHRRAEKKTRRRPVSPADDHA